MNPAGAGSPQSVRGAFQRLSLPGIQAGLGEYSSEGASPRKQWQAADREVGRDWKSPRLELYISWQSTQHLYPLGIRSIGAEGQMIFREHLGLGYDPGSAISALLPYGLHFPLSGRVYGVGVGGFHTLGEEGLIGSSFRHPTGRFEALPPTGSSLSLHP